MTESVVTYITDEMRASIGIWRDMRTSPPVSLSDIRKWAIATYWPQQPPPIYWDAAYGASTQWQGIIAPPDFNPFAWSVEGVQLRNKRAKRPNGKPLNGMNGGQTETYGKPMRPGDVITARSRLTDWNERMGRFGLTLYTTTEIEWRNQNGDFVKRKISISIRH